MLMIIAKLSETNIAHQTPFKSKKIGNTITAVIWNITVLINDIAKEANPLIRAVKKADANMLKPHIKKQPTYIRIPFTVILHKPSSEPTKILVKGYASASDSPVIIMPEINIITRLFRNIFFTSNSFFAPK